MTRVSASVKQRDSVALRKSAHALEGSLMSVGAKPASNSASTLVQVAALDDPSEADELLADLTQ